MVSVYFFRLSEKTEYNTDNFSENVKSHCQKIESIAAASALISMGVKNLHYDENGKPFADSCFVSISHSKDFVAVCKSDNPVGIDVEFIDCDRDFLRMSKRFFKGHESEFFNNSPTASAFYELWTKKEAYSKIGGKGVAEIFGGFDIYSLNGYEFSTEIVDDYVISVCEKY